jgi:uncharacterized membrane protein YqaE (UPF0057 family)
MAGRYNNTPGQGNDAVSSRASRLSPSVMLRGRSSHPCASVPSTRAVILVVLAIFFPPAVPLILSGCGADFCINLLLTILAWFPGCIHALYLIYKQAKVNEQTGYVYAGVRPSFLPSSARPQQPR